MALAAATVVLALGARQQVIAGDAAPIATVPAVPAVPTTPAPPSPTTLLQRRLAELGYDVGPADGAIGSRTRFAIMAFQKVEGLARTGEPSDELLTALASASRPSPIVPGGEATRVEISLTRQVLLFWRDGELARVLPVSTGSGKTYCVNGHCERAVTSTGTFRIGRKVPGVDPGPLGPLYSPMYFNKGVAIHGAPSVPAYPASHGCARIPMYAHASFFAQVPVGTAVYVVAG